MKKQQTILIIFLLSLTTNNLLFSQVRVVNSITNSSIASSSTFMDASSNGTINGSTNIGKGLLFPSTDLTTFATFNVSGPLGIDANYPTFFDGMVVYNTATGTSAIGAVAVTPGYYYYSNPGQTFPTGSATAGTWTPMGGGAAGGTNVSDTPTTSATINGEEELVVRVEGVADGNTTHLDLSAALTTGTVGTFRLAKIFNATTGAAIMEATGAYDSVNNTVVTGNGMMNFLLDSGIYTVELYYFAP